MTKNRIRKCAFLLFAVLSNSVHASVLDQYNLLPPPGPNTLHGGYLIGGYRVGQTFRVGQTGYLDHIDLQMSFAGETPHNNPLDFAVYRVTDGVPAGGPLAISLFYPNGDLATDYSYTTVSVDFSFMTELLAEGDEYAIVAQLSPPYDDWWGLWATNEDYANVYEDGHGILQYGDDPWINIDVTEPTIIFDLSFATYMRPVPIPSALILLLSALGALLAKRR